MTRNAFSIIRIAAIILLAAIVGGYTLFQAWKIIEGPVIQVDTPQNGAVYNSPLVEIDGLARNAAYLYLDDRPIFTDRMGRFSERLLLMPGLNIIKFNAIDKFKRQSEKTLQIILKEY